MNKKFLKRFFLLIISLLLLVGAVSGCSDYENDGERITGTWIGSVELGKSAGLDKEIFFEIELTFDGKENLTSSYNTAKMIKTLKKALREVIEQQLKMTVEEWEKKNNADFDKNVEQTVEQFGEQMTFSFKYSLKKSVLMIDGGAVEYEFDGDDTLKIKMSPFENTEFKRK